jgi:hypothetical protein
MPSAVNRRVLAWAEIDAMERQLKALSAASGKLKRTVDAGMLYAERLPGTKGFAPLVSVGLACHVLTVVPASR